MDFALPGRTGGASDVFIVGRVGAEKCGRGRTRSSGRRIPQGHSAWNSYRSIGYLDLVLTSFVDNRLVLDLSCPCGEPVIEHQYLLLQSGRPLIDHSLQGPQGILGILVSRCEITDQHTHRASTQSIYHGTVISSNLLSNREPVFPVTLAHLAVSG